MTASLLTSTRTAARIPLGLHSGVVFRPACTLLSGQALAYTRCRATEIIGLASHRYQNKSSNGCLHPTGVTCSRRQSGLQRTIAVLLSRESNARMAGCEVDRTILGRLLESLGYRVIFCRNGEEAVQYYTKKAGNISCIWMDIHMPILDGLQATKQIRSIEKARTVHGQLWQEFSVETPISIYQKRHELRGERDTASLCTLQIPVIGVSACSKEEQLTSATFDGLLPNHPTEQQPWKLYGMDLFIEKPATIAKLRHAIVQLEAMKKSQ